MKPSRFSMRPGEVWCDTDGGAICLRFDHAGAGPFRTDNW
jgi:hypothetical protein